jgi:hypothetical protein
MLTNVWAFTTDAVAAGLIVMVFSSYMMWYRLKAKHRGGVVALVLGVASCDAFVAGLRWLFEDALPRASSALSLIPGRIHQHVAACDIARESPDMLAISRTPRRRSSTCPRTSFRMRFAIVVAHRVVCTVALKWLRGLHLPHASLREINRLCRYPSAPPNNTPTYDGRKAFSRQVTPCRHMLRVPRIRRTFSLVSLPV